MEQKIVRKSFSVKLEPDLYRISTLTQILMTLVTLRLGILVTDLFQEFEIYVVTFTLKLITHGQELT